MLKRRRVDDFILDEVAASANGEHSSLPARRARLASVANARAKASGLLGGGGGGGGDGGGGSATNAIVASGRRLGVRQQPARGVDSDASLRGRGRGVRADGDDDDEQANVGNAFDPSDVPKTLGSPFVGGYSQLMPVRPMPLYTIDEDGVASNMQSMRMMNQHGLGREERARARAIAQLDSATSFAPRLRAVAESMRLQVSVSLLLS